MTQIFTQAPQLLHAGLPNHRTVIESASQHGPDWPSSNPRIVQPQSRITYILSRDEADLTLYNACRYRTQPSDSTLILAIDSDYNIIPSAHEVSYTLNYVKFANRGLRKAADNHYVVTDNRLVHSHGKFPWADDVARRAAAAMAGCDYLPGGIRGLGFKTMAGQQAFHRDVSSRSSLGLASALNAACYTREKGWS